MPTIRITSLLLLLLLTLPAFAARSPMDADGRKVGGELRIIDDQGQAIGACPLEHTAVEADITGHLARTRVTQTFKNPRDAKIEAVYTFPLPEDAAVDRMVMTVGERRIVGKIKPREEAKAIYDQAKERGHVASLLEQERPNIFTQSVANIEPGATVVIEISYVEALPYDEGWYEFTFPTVVGPRFIPGGSPADARGPMERGKPTSEVPDGDRITPPITPPNTRAGHDLSVKVTIDAGMAIDKIESELHEIDVARDGGEGGEAGQKATVTLKDQETIPNRDFVLRYRSAGEKIGDAFLVHDGGEEGGRFFTLFLQPPARVTPAQAVPKEMIFVIDCSGSMRGFPIEKAKDVMRLAILNMNPDDTFNLYSFSGGLGEAFDKPVPNTRENVEKAVAYLNGLSGGGGTQMMPAIQEALRGQSADDKVEGGRLRIVAFMTDGFIGNDFAILDEVQKSVDTARVFSFGIGNSVNRFLLENMAEMGRGESQFVMLNEGADEKVDRFRERIQSPVLTDITIDWGNLPVEEVYPQRVGDLFAAGPIRVHGRLKGSDAVKGTITLKGRTVEGPYERKIEVSTAEATVPADADAMASLWARQKVEALMRKDLKAMQRGTFPDDLNKQIVDTALAHDLMTQFTSFVAVEETWVTEGGTSKTVDVPVEMPQGVSYEGVYGGPEQDAARRGLRGLGEGDRSMPVEGSSRFVDVDSLAAMESAPVAPARSEPGGDGGVQVADAPREQLETSVQPPSDTPDATPADDASAKLAPSLRGLAERVQKDGTDGHLTDGDVVVKDWMVSVEVVMTKLVDEEVLAALKEAGFIIARNTRTDVSARNTPIGKIDVRKLDALAKLDLVGAIRPHVNTPASAPGPVKAAPLD